MSKQPSAPWIVVEISTGWMVLDADGKILASIHGSDQPRNASDSRLTRDQARRIADGIARLPELNAYSKRRSSESDERGT